jgi:hypothetical protein
MNELELSEHRTKLLAEVLVKVLVKDGVIAGNRPMTGPELLGIAETYAEGCNSFHVDHAWITDSNNRELYDR